MRSRRLVNGSLIALCALGAVACNSTPNPIPSPSPSNSNIGGGGGNGGGSPALSVLTQHNDGFRTGQNLSETILTRGNVNPTSFGKIGALPVDGLVYAQPLVAAGVKTATGTQDILYVATENDSVYAFDSDSLSPTPIWHRSMLDNCPNAAIGPCTILTPTDTGGPQVAPEVGITSTPVIDPNAGVIYVASVLKDATGAIYWMLHGLDLGSGQEIPGSPVTIEGSLPGTGAGSNLSTDQQIHFDPARQLSRAGLVLDNGLVYVAFASWNDQEPSHGWLFAYDSATLEPVSAYITTPNSGEGTIWQAGAAPAVDENGSLYFSAGNSDPGTSQDLGNSILKVTFGAQGFDLADYFTPHNFVELNVADIEVGSGGVMLIPDQLGSNPHLMVGGGKEGTIYLLDRDNMGKLNPDPNATSDSQIVQELPLLLTNGQEGADFGSGIYGVPAYYQNKLFWTAATDSLRSIPLVNGQLQSASMSVSPIQIPTRGATPSISADGNANGIVWYIDAGAYTYTLDATGLNPVTRTDGPAVLFAFSTDDLSTPLYASGPAPINESCSTPPCINPPAGSSRPSYTGPASDSAGYAVKYVVPTIVNGKVFVGTDTEISVYGLRNTQLAQNTQRETDISLSRSVASLLELGDSHQEAAVAKADQAQNPRFDFWNLRSNYRSCGYHSGGSAYTASLY